MVAESPVPVELSPPFHHLFSMTPLLFQAFPDPQLLFPSPIAGGFGVLYCRLSLPLARWTNPEV